MELRINRVRINRSLPVMSLLTSMRQMRSITNAHKKLEMFGICDHTN